MFCAAVAKEVSEGVYLVEDEWHKTHTVNGQDLKVDSLTAPAL